MISVEWNKLGKRFGLKWVFRDLNGVIPSGAHVVIRGSNGSGKSTFGKLLVGATESTEGEMSWNLNGSKVGIDEVAQLIAWSAPFMEVPEEMTVSEVIQFHNNFRESWSDGYMVDLLGDSGLDSHKNSQINTLSSGQKQRLRLILAMGTKAELVVLDEPCSNLDESGINWYGEELLKLSKKATVVVCSNNRPEEHLKDALEIRL